MKIFPIKTCLAVAVLVFNLMTITAFAKSFPDIVEDHANFSAIEYLEANGIIHGYEDGTFRPNNLVNRAEAMKIIVGAFGIEQKADSDVLFPDVKKDQWFFPFVMGGYSAGIVNGYDDGYFRPEDTINLAETLKLVSIASGVELPLSVEADVFLDVPAIEWYAPYALYARDHNVVFSDDFGRISSAMDMTRADFAEVIYRMMIVLENDGEAFSLHDSWPYFESDTLPFKMKYSPDWQLIDNGDEVVFFKPNEEIFQFSPKRIYANSASVTVSLDKNVSVLDKNSYFANLKTVFSDAETTEFNYLGFPAFEVLYSENRIVDWYLYLNNGEVLAVYTEYGDGILSYQLPRFIQAMLSTLEYQEVAVNSSVVNQELLSEILSNILIKGKGMEMINLLSDKLIIETDTIGVGTGAVDYYYSSALNYTFKYERSDDLILDSRSGKTSSF